MIASAKPTETKEFTLRWLRKYFNFNVFVSVVNKEKADLDADVLIDDNIENIFAFSARKGVGILFSQPWNREREELKPMIKEGKVRICKDWPEVLKQIEELDFQ